jgi:hypothetical protein
MNGFRLPAIFLLVVAAISAGIATATEWSFWWIFAIAGAAILSNGLFATLEDDLPGGINNSDGKSTPKYVVVVGWVVRGVGLLAGAFVIVMLGLHFWGTR